MKIDKAIRKQTKFIKRFLFSRCFIFFTIIGFLVYYKNINMVEKWGCIFVNFLIFTSILRTMQKKYLKYNIGHGSAKIKSGIISDSKAFKCNKVVLVDAQNNTKHMKIVIVLISQLKKKEFIRINENFLNKYSQMNERFSKIKSKYKNEKYYCVIVKRGEFMKYRLLNDLFINCSNAFFTDEAIEKIKEYRN